MCKIKNVIFDFGRVIVTFDELEMTRVNIPNEDEAVLAHSVIFDRAYWDLLDLGDIADEVVEEGIRSRLPAHLHEAAELLRAYEGKVWQQIFPSGGTFPELLKLRPQKEYVRGVLKSVRLTGVEEGFEEIDTLPDTFRYFSYNAKIHGNLSGVGTHTVVERVIKQSGEDYRIQDREHPIDALADRTADNLDVGRVKGV